MVHFLLRSYSARQVSVNSAWIPNLLGRLLDTLAATHFELFQLGCGYNQGACSRKCLPCICHPESAILMHEHVQCFRERPKAVAPREN